MTLNLYPMKESKKTDPVILLHFFSICYCSVWPQMSKMHRPEREGESGGSGVDLCNNKTNHHGAMAGL